MTDAEISRRLALAIGWPWALELCQGIVYVSEDGSRLCQPFDYRDPAVIWPIAERFCAFPWHSRCGPDGWFCGFNASDAIASADTAAKAVALAVIAAKEKA